MSEQEFAGARNLMNASYEEMRKAQEQATAAEAVLLGLSLVEDHAARYAEGAIVGYSFDYSSEYDDEGSYFDAIYLRVITDEALIKEDEYPDEDSEIQEGGWTKEAMFKLFDFDEETRSVEEIRTKVDQLQQNLGLSAAVDNG